RRRTSRTKEFPTMNLLSTRTAVISALALFSLAGCSGGSDASPDDLSAPGSMAEPLAAPSTAPSSAPEAASKTGDANEHHCDGRRNHDPKAFMKRFDANGDGALQVSELPAPMQKWMGKADT